MQDRVIFRKGILLADLDGLERHRLIELRVQLLHQPLAPRVVRETDHVRVPHLRQIQEPPKNVLPRQSHVLVLPLRRQPHAPNRVLRVQVPPDLPDQALDEQLDPHERVLVKN